MNTFINFIESIFWDTWTNYIRNYIFNEWTIQTFLKYNTTYDKDKIGNIMEWLKEFYYMNFSNKNIHIWMPIRIIDEMWHSHILNTKEYNSFCSHAFWKFLNHNPFIKNFDIEDEKEADFNFYKIVTKDPYTYKVLSSFLKDLDKWTYIDYLKQKELEDKKSKQVYSSNNNYSSSSDSLWTIAAISTLWILNYSDTYSSSDDSSSWNSCDLTSSDSCSSNLWSWSSHSSCSSCSTCSSCSS